MTSPRRGPIERYFQRNRLLQAAAGAFAKHGIRDATVDDILEAAAISRRTFYQYFRSKDELLIALFTVSCELLLQVLRGEIQRGPDATRIERCVETYLAFRTRAGTIMLELEAEARRPGSPLEPIRRDLLDAASRELANAIPSDDGRQVDPLVVHGVLVALEGIAHRMASPDPCTEDRARAAMLRIARSALLDGGSP